MNSDIIRASRGALNAGAGDSVVGMSATPLGLGTSRFAGQLGQSVWLDNPLFDASLAPTVLYRGRYRYVRFRNLDAITLTPGTLLFADTTVASWQTAFQVTTDEDIEASGVPARFLAGVAISPLDHGNYWFVQEAGLAWVTFRAVLSVAGAIGCGVYCAALDTGIGVADNATADVLDPNAGAAAITNIGAMIERYIGKGITAPAGAGTSLVALGFKSPWGDE